MGFLESFFFDKKEEAPEPKKQVQSPVVAPATPVVEISSGTDYNTMIDAEINAKNLPGPDFLEFMQDLTDMGTMSVMEGQKYQSLFARFNRSGITPAKIADSGNHYLSVLDTVRTEFLEELKVANSQQVEGKEKKAKDLQVEIDTLNKQIQEKLSSIKTLNAEAATSRQKLSVEEAAFNVTYNNKKQHIQEVISKIQTYSNAKLTT